MLPHMQEPRHRITALCFAATFVAYVERVGFSIAYTAMAKQAGVSEALKGSVLSAFYWGYSLSQVPPLLPALPLLVGTQADAIMLREKPGAFIGATASERRSEALCGMCADSTT